MGCSSPLSSALSAPRCQWLLIHFATSLCPCPWRRTAPWKSSWCARIPRADPRRLALMGNAQLVFSCSSSGLEAAIFLVNLTSDASELSALLLSNKPVLSHKEKRSACWMTDRSERLLCIRCVLCLPSQYRVVVPKLGMVSDLCSALSKLTGVPAENVRLPPADRLCVHVWCHLFAQIIKSLNRLILT